MDTEDEKTGDWKIGLTWPTGIAIVVLTLAVWIFFYVEHMALDAGGTAVVALVMTIVAVAGRWLWLRTRRSPDASAPEGKK